MKTPTGNQPGPGSRTIAQTRELAEQLEELVARMPIPTLSSNWQKAIDGAKKINSNK